MYERAGFVSHLHPVCELFLKCEKKHFVLSRGGGTQMSTLQMDGP